jgi:AcrR family transcriptional regulator
MTIEGDQTRARLLAEARDHFLEAGFDHFSLREVARRCDLTAAAVYRHYDGKEALLREVCGEGFRIFSSYLLKALTANEPSMRMKLSIDQYLKFALENPADYRFIFMASAADVARLAPSSPSTSREPTFQFLIDRVKECMEAKIFAKMQPEATATVIWAHVHGLVSLRLSGLLSRVGVEEVFERFFKRATQHLLIGLMR